MPNTIEKATAFITRKSESELLLIKHPYAGIQIPAGTVEPGEMPQPAVLREVREETGLTKVRIISLLGTQDENLPKNTGVVTPPATVYSRPDLTSFDWVKIRSAVQVQIERKVDEFTQITYIEPDKVPDPEYVSMQITGWIQNDNLACTRRRYFFHLAFTSQSADRWMKFTDNHNFTLFWAPVDHLPAIIPPQDSWLAYFLKI